jgi:hypothetical protein
MDGKAGNPEMPFLEQEKSENKKRKIPSGGEVPKVGNTKSKVIEKPTGDMKKEKLLPNIVK